MAAQRALKATQSLLSIGQVLELLQDDFNDLTLSKLRFLEEQGLVTPARTDSGYRKFGQQHIERLRLILTLQRDHYLPLKVISGILEDLDQGREPVIPGGTPKQAATILSPNAVLTRDEMMRQTGASSQLLGEAIATGLLPAADVFPRESLSVLESIVSLTQKGITPRHLRSVRLAAEKDVELLKQAALNRGRVGSGQSVKEEALVLAQNLEVIRTGVLKHYLMNSIK